MRVEYLSIDPAMRTWMNAGRSYVPPVEIGEVMRAGGIGRMIESRHPDFAVGDEVYGVFGVQRYALSDGRDVTPVDTNLAPAPVHLGVLGISGLTAYFGLLDVGRPAAGSDRRRLWRRRFGGQHRGADRKDQGLPVDRYRRRPGEVSLAGRGAGIRRRHRLQGGDLRAQLKTHAPNGIDVFFDNVGGETLEAALARLARGARIVICGAISQYNADGGGPRAGQLHAATGRTGDHDRLRDLRLRRPLSPKALRSWRIGCVAASCTRASRSSTATSATFRMSC